MIDVAIDQEGYFETSYPTIHDAPIKIKEGIIHYAETNMSGAEFSNTSLPHDLGYFEYVLRLSNKGWKKAFGKIGVFAFWLERLGLPAKT